MRVALIGKHGHYYSAIQEAKDDKRLVFCGVAPGVPGEDMSEISRMTEDELGQSIRLFDTWGEMVESAKPDICIVNTEFYMNAEISAKLLRQGIHVFAEKPSAINLAQLDDLVDAYAEGKAEYMSMFTYYYSPAYEKVHSLIKDGAIGRVRLINAQKSYRLGERPKFFGDLNKFGGTIPWVGSHAAQWAYQMSQSAEFISAYAMSNNADNYGNGSLDMCAVMQFEMSDGILFTANIDYLRPACAPSHGDDRLRVVGTGGIVEIIGGDINIISPGLSGAISPDKPDTQIFKEFMRMTGGSPARFSAKDCFKITRAVLCAQLSAVTGEVVRIEKDVSY